MSLTDSQKTLLAGALGGGAAALAVGIPIGLSKQMLIMDGVGAAAAYLYHSYSAGGMVTMGDMGMVYSAAIGGAAAYALFKFAPSTLV